MRIMYSRVIDCSGMTPAECSDLFLVAIEHGPFLSFRADTPSSVVHGAITIAHNNPPTPHEVWVDVYENDQSPIGGRRSTLKRPVPMPTEQAILDLLARR